MLAKNADPISIYQNKKLLYNFSRPWVVFQVNQAIKEKGKGMLKAYFWDNS